MLHVLSGWGTTEYVGKAKGDTIGLVIPNLSSEIREAMNIPYPAIGAIGGRVGVGAQAIAIDEAVKDTNAQLLDLFMPRDTKGGGGHGSLILVGAYDVADVRRAIEKALELTDVYFGGVYVSDAGHMDMHYTARAGSAVAQAFGAPEGQAFGLICACPGAIGMVAADAALKAASTQVISVSTPDKGTSHTNEIILMVTGDAAAVLQAVQAGRAIALDLLAMMGDEAQPLSKPYF